MRKTLHTNILKQLNIELEKLLTLNKVNSNEIDIYESELKTISVSLNNSQNKQIMSESNQQLLEDKEQILIYKIDICRSSISFSNKLIESFKIEISKNQKLLELFKH